MCSIDLDPCELWNEVVRRARKLHRCSVCGGPIPVGARYTAHFSKHDEGISSERVCTPCQRARDRFAKAHEGQHVTPSGFTFLLEECIYDGDEDSERRWKPMLAAIKRRSTQAAAP